MADAAQAPTLESISQRLDRIEDTLARLDRVFTQAPAVVATVTDVADELAERSMASGVLPEERVEGALTLLEQLTEPRVIQALTAVLDRIERVQILVEQLDALPGVIATVMDIVDEFLLKAADKGHDIEHLVHTGVDILGRFANLMQSREFQGLLDSGVLNPEVVGVIGQLGRALGEARSESAGRAGWLSVFRASRDPDVQRTLDFSVRFLRHLGTTLESSGDLTLEPVARKELPNA